MGVIPDWSIRGSESLLAGLDHHCYCKRLLTCSSLLAIPSLTARQTLTVMYHILQRKINIRKETSMSISVFSIASFISMVAMLAQLHFHMADFPHVPLFVLAKKAWEEGSRIIVRALEYGNGARARLDEL